MTPHGLPDWGLVGPRQQTYGLDDVGEAAVRLGSPISYDRRGDVIWFEDWRGGLVRVVSGWAGAGGAADLVTTVPVHSPFCIRLTGGSTLARQAYLSRNLPLGYLTVQGLEVWFRPEYHNELIVVELTRAAIPWYASARIRIDIPNDQLSYYNDLGGYTVFLNGIGITEFESGDSVLKLVVDFVNNTYVRVLLNGVTHLLTDIPVRVTGYAGGAVNQLVVTTTSEPLENSKLYLSLLVATQNEPVSQT